jgi:hypothetical protein
LRDAAEANRRQGSSARLEGKGGMSTDVDVAGLNLERAVTEEA